MSILCFIIASIMAIKGVNGWGLVFICLVIVEWFIMLKISKVNISLISMLLFVCYFAYKCRQDEKLAVVRANKAEEKYEK